MALETNDLAAIKSMLGGSHEGMTPYEQMKVATMQSRRPSGAAIGGLATGIAAAVAAVGVGFYASARSAAARQAARQAQEVATAKNDGLRDLVTMLGSTLATERAERIAGDTTITQTVNDTVSGSQQGTLTAQQQSELSALQNMTNNVMSGLMTGRYSENPVQYVRVSGRRECGCDDGCGR